MIPLLLPSVSDTRGEEQRALPAYEKPPAWRVVGYSMYGAGNETRTRYLHLGKVALYRMSYARTRNEINNTTFS